MKKTFTFFLIWFSGINAWTQSNLCASATLIPVGTTTCTPTAYSFNNTFTDELVDPSCGASLRDAWFRFVATSDYTTIVVSSNQSGLVGTGDIVLSVYSSCSSASQVGCSNISGNAGAFGGAANEALTVPTTIGATYYVRISRVNNCGFICAGLGGTNTTSGTICAIESSEPVNNRDCSTSAVICDNSVLSSNASGFGTQELHAGNRGCLTNNEHQTNWYVFSPQSTGTIEFTINPLTPIDYDFAIWGPFSTVNCATLGSPFRCSYAAPSAGLNQTGLQSGAGDVTEPASGDGWVDPITIGPAEVGQIYVMVVDNWTNNGVPFTLQWNLGGGLSLDCTIPLPVILSEFEGQFDPNNNTNKIYWVTESEINCELFNLESSFDGVSWQKIHTVSGQGNSNTSHHYSVTDESPNEITYYRLIQVDYDGTEESYGPIAVYRDLINKPLQTKLYPNPANEYVTIETKYSGEAKILISNSMGKVLKHEKIILNGFSKSISLNGLNDGIYNLQIMTDYHTENHKLIIQ